MAPKKPLKRKATKRNATKRKTIKRKANKPAPRVTVSGTVEALKDLAAKWSEIPGLIIKRVGF